jgi:folate-binding protein YgfZ
MLNAPQLAQYQALNHQAGYAPLARTQVSLTGADRTTMLHKFCTQDILSLQAGQGSEAFICNVQGKIVGYVYVFIDTDSIVLDCAAGQGEALIAHLDRYVIREDVAFADQSATYREVVVGGSAAARELTALCGAPPPEELYAHKRMHLGDAAVTVRKTPYLAPFAYFLSCPTAEEDSLIAALDRAGVVRCDLQVIEAARIESGAPLYGIDITAENLPQEVARDAVAIHFKKGCYLGQETVARIDALGHVNKLLVQLKYPLDATPAPGDELLLDDKKVGRLTSVCDSPAAEGKLALAYVRREHAAPGTHIGAAEVWSPRV